MYMCMCDDVHVTYFLCVVYYYNLVPAWGEGEEGLRKKAIVCCNIRGPTNFHLHCCF